MHPRPLQFFRPSLLPAACVAFFAFAGSMSGHGAAPDRLEAIASALRAEPDNPALLVEQADLLVEHGDHAVARRALDRADRLAPGRFPTDRVRARLFFEEGLLPESLACLDQAVAAHPDDTEARFLRARVLRATGELQKSLDDYLEACSRTEFVAGDHAVEAADALAEAGKTSEAVSVLTKAVSSQGRMPSLLTRLIDLEIARGRTNEALAWVDAMRERAPRPEPWMVRRAELLAAAGRPEEAERAWTELDAHLRRLPSLERGSPLLRPVTERVARALAAARASGSANQAIPFPIRQ